MLFNSYEFILLYLPLAVVGFYLVAKWIGKSWAALWLVIMSVSFYGWWDYRYVPLLLVSIVCNYFVGCKIEKSNTKKRWLIAGIVFNVLLLGYYKYTGFFIDTINNISGIFMEVPEIILPLGISFFTFTQTAYLVDAYRGNTKNDGFIEYCEFVTIFPHLIAGPIISHKEMMPQFKDDATYRVNYDNIAKGVGLFSMALFKKVVVADSIAPWVNDVFDISGPLSMGEAWLGSLGYTLQLYFDFSAYSEMAIALGLMLNLKFPVNFNSPYKSLSIIDFWRRWHMTLGAWVREYLYIPLGGARKGELRKMANLFVSMSIIGLWHGAGWTYVIWGSLNGLFLVINNQWRRLNINMPKFLCWLLTFACFVFSITIFRAENLSDAWSVLQGLFNFQYMVPEVNRGSIMVHLRFCIALTVVIMFLPNPLQIIEKFKPNAIWLAISMAIFLYVMTEINKYTEFLYFQF